MTDRDTPGRASFRPALWASLLAGLGLCVLVALGTWQLQRKTEKEALIELIRSRGEGQAIALPVRLTPVEDLVFTRVRVSGRFLHDKEMRLTNKVLKGEVGRHLVTPFLLDDGRTLLVDRGWVPMRLEDPRSRPGSQPEGRLRIEGILRIGGYGGPAFLRPENAPQEGLYNWPDLEGMAEAAALDNPITVLYLAAVETISEVEPSGRYPQARVAEITLRNDHLEYALTWYGLAGVLVVIYTLYHLRRRSPRP
jgi:surfeit locus 1 family protein